MIDFTKANGVRVGIGTVPPAKRLPLRPDLDPLPLIAPMNDGQGRLARADSDDGFHPLPPGYLKMEAEAKKGLGARR